MDPLNNNDVLDNSTEPSLLKCNLQDYETYHSNDIYKTVCKKIKDGNIKPNGPRVSTPNNLKLPLKVHQERILYEMLKKEKNNYRVTSNINAFVIADKVGSGKSLDVLSLICKKPTVNKPIPNKLHYKINTYQEFGGLQFTNKCVRLKTNLIVIPHGIYKQWQGYINNYTSLNWYGISYRIDVVNLDLTKVINGDYALILVKSTRYNDLMDKIYLKYPYTLDRTNNVLDLDKKTNTLIESISSQTYNVYSKLRNKHYNSSFIDDFMKLKTLVNDVDMLKLKDSINKLGKYKLSFIKKYSGPMFERVFIDEANSIKVPRFRYAYSKITWFITSSVDDLLYPRGKKDWYKNKVIINGIKGSGFIKNTFYTNSGKQLCNFIQDMYLKNNDDFVKASFKIPEPNYISTQCYTPPELKALQNVAIPEIISALNAGDITSAIEKVGCSVTDEDNIVELVLQTLNKRLLTKQNSLKQKETVVAELLLKIETHKNVLENLNKCMFTSENIKEDLDMSTEELIVYKISEVTLLLDETRSKKNSLNQTIKAINAQITNLEFKIASLKSRITNINDKDCPICSEKISNPCMTPCCKNIFCISCVAMSLNYSKEKKCPYCRKTLTLSSVVAISSKTIIENINVSNLPTKIDSLITLIHNKPNGKFLIFSEYDNSFTNIANTLWKDGITFSKLSGSSGRIMNILDKYSNGIFKVLLLNAKHYGSGLNLQMTTDIIIYHRMSNDLENQIIGRAQRPGRKTKLNIHFLCYETESLHN